MIFRQETGIGSVGGFSLESRAEARVVGHTLSTVTWTNDNGRWSGILKTTSFLAFVMPLWAPLVRESQKRPVAARLLTMVSLNRSMRLTDADNSNDKSLIL